MVDNADAGDSVPPPKASDKSKGKAKKESTTDSAVKKTKKDVKVKKSDKEAMAADETPETVDVAEQEDDGALGTDKDKEKEERLHRNARRILSAIVRAMPTIAPNLRLKGTNDKVVHNVKIPYLEKFTGMIQPSYVIVKGTKERFLYFACLNQGLFEMIKQILITDVELREQLTVETVKIQFGCPKIGKGLLFKKVSKGFLRGKRTAMYSFDFKDKGADAPPSRKNDGDGDDKAEDVDGSS